MELQISAITALLLIVERRIVFSKYSRALRTPSLQVRSNPSGIVGFLGDHRRMNVGVTRARMHVAVVCDSSTVGRNPFLLRLLQHIKRRGEVRSAAGGDAQGPEFTPPLPMSKWKGQGNGLYRSTS